MRHQLFIVLIMLFLSEICLAQKIEFDLNYKFQDGIYLSFNQLLSNKPEFVMTPALEQFISNSLLDDKILKKLNKKRKGQKLKLKDLWVICMQGVPLRITPTSNFIFTGNKYSTTHTPTKLNLIRFIALGRITTFRTPSEYYIFKQGDLRSIKLNSNNLTFMLIDEPNLYAKFKKDRKSKNNLFHYIKEYNRINPIYIREN